MKKETKKERFDYDKVYKEAMEPLPDMYDVWREAMIEGYKSVENKKEE